MPTTATKSLPLNTLYCRPFSSFMTCSNHSSSIGPSSLLRSASPYHDLYSGKSSALNLENVRGSLISVRTNRDKEVILPTSPLCPYLIQPRYLGYRYQLGT